VKTVSQEGEDALIRRVCQALPQGGQVLVGPGDDCAVIETGKRTPLTLLKTDAVVEGVHFLPEAAASKVGWKAVARVLSDFAAMGGYGRELLVTLAVSADTPVRWIDGLYRGMQRCAEKFETSIVGGETTSVPIGNSKVISIAGRGEVARRQLVLRSGGRPGDGIFVTGKLGGSLAGRHLTFTPRVAEAAWLTEHFSPTAMMDLSDGLARDLPRLARASACGFEIDQSSVPRHRGCSVENALSDGEDFELLFTLGARSCEKIAEQWPSIFPPLTRVGSLASSGGCLEGGWGHFEEAGP